MSGGWGRGGNVRGNAEGYGGELGSRGRSDSAVVIEGEKVV